VDDEFRKYGIEYGYGKAGGRWVLEVMATSPEDAMDRVRAAGTWGQCYTPHGIAMSIPAAGGGWLPRLIVATVNLFNRKG
jgi:hypothetical protein